MVEEGTALCPAMIVAPAVPAVKRPAAGSGKLTLKLFPITLRGMLAGIRSNRIRLAIAGTGDVANGHVEALESLSDMVEIVALADVVPGRAQEFAGKHGLGSVKICRHFEEAIALADVDALDICTRWESHGPAALAAFTAGKHVFCEKPMAGSAVEARNMLAAAEASGLVHGINFTYRNYLMSRLVKQLLGEGTLGDLLRIRLEYLLDVTGVPRHPDPSRPAANLLGDIASHTVDLARYFAGEVMRVLGSYKLDGENRESVNAIIDLAGGAVGTIEASSTATGRTPHYRRGEIHGTRGAAVLHYSSPHQVELYTNEGGIAGNGKFETVTVPGMKPVRDDHEGWVLGIRGALESFARAIRTGAAMDGDFRDGYRSQVVIEAIARSSA